MSPLYTVDRAEGLSAKETENEERKQEDVMKRFRCRDCNVLVATSVVEEGVEVPPCHLIVRFDLPRSFKAYANSKARARARNSYYALLVETDALQPFLADLSQFHAVEQVLLHKSGFRKSLSETAAFSEEDYNFFQAPYCPEQSRQSASLQNAIALINR